VALKRTATMRSNIEDEAPAVPGGTSALLAFRDVSLRFPGSDRLTLRDINFDITEGEFVAIIGPSGCGKSTLLNLAAGLLAPSDGEVLFRGTRLDRVNVGAAYVTQDANLLPWLRVAGNVGLPLRIRGEAQQERARKVADWLSVCGLTGFESYFPAQLSGGMQKRCSIARAFISGPSVILMDEPFGPLDALTRAKLQQELTRIVESRSCTVAFVTHDLVEAISLADKVVVMSSSPGEVQAQLEVPLSRPRDLSQITGTDVFQQLLTTLRSYFDLDGKA